MAPQEVADQLGVDVQTVRRWIHAGRLRAFKPGKEYRIREADLEEFLRAREVRPKAPSRSPFEPTLNDALADEERGEATYQPWLDFVNRYADSWERRIETGDFNLGNIYEFAAICEDLMPTLHELNAAERRAQGFPPQPYSFGAPAAKTGSAILRLADLINPMVEASARQFEESELEQIRRARERAQRALERTA